MNEPDACLNPACLRKTTAMYCCTACDLAHQNGYEIHDDGSRLAHSEGCNERNAERGEFDPLLAAERRMMKSRHYRALHPVSKP